MSDVMLFGVIQMPYEMAMDGELSRRQFYDRAQQALAELQSSREHAVTLTKALCQAKQIMQSDGYNVKFINKALYS